MAIQSWSTNLSNLKWQHFTKSIGFQRLSDEFWDTFFFLLPLPHYNSIKKKKSSLLIRVQPKKIKDPIHNLQTPGVKTVKRQPQLSTRSSRLSYFSTSYSQKHRLTWATVWGGKKGNRKRKLMQHCYTIWKEVGGYIYLFTIIIRTQNQSSYGTPKLKDLKFQFLQ